MMCKVRGWMDKEGHYDMELKGWMQRRCNMMCKLKWQIDKGEHYDMQMKGWMQRIGHYDVQIKRMDG